MKMNDFTGFLKIQHRETYFTDNNHLNVKLGPKSMCRINEDSPFGTSFEENFD